MDIMELGAIGELVGGVAVIASLVYLAVQVRQSTQVMQAQTVSSRLAGQSAAEVALMGHDGAEAMAKAYDQPGELSRAEMIKIDNYLYSAVAAMQTSYEAYELGLSSRDDWDAVQRIAPAYLSFAYGRVWLKEVKSWFPEAFIAELERAIRDAGPDEAFLRFDRMKTAARSAVGA